MNKIRYFATFREQAGKEEDEMMMIGKRLDQSYHEVKNKYAFSLSVDQVRFAVNQDYQDPNYIVQPGDEIIFIPPIAGG